MPGNPAFTEQLLERIKLLERKLTLEPVSRDEVLDVIRTGLKAMSTDMEEIERQIGKPTFSVRRRTGLALVEAASAIQKAMSLLGRIDSQMVKPFSALVHPEISTGDLMQLADDDIGGVEVSDEDAHYLQNDAALAAAEEWVHVAWGKLWIGFLEAWTNGYGRSGSKPWLDFLEEAYNIGDETPKSRSWLRRKFDEVYERCAQQPDLKKTLVGRNGRLPERPGRGRKTQNFYVKHESKKVKQWRCTGTTPTGDCGFAISPNEAVDEGLKFPEWASEDDYRRCPESLFCGGLCRPQFQ